MFGLTAVGRETVVGPAELFGYTRGGITVGLVVGFVNDGWSMANGTVLLDGVSGTMS